LYASDGVLKAINDYLKAYVSYKESGGDDQARTWGAVQAAEGQLRLCVRKDLRPATQVTPQWVAGEWEMIVASPERILRYLGRSEGGAPGTGASARADESAPAASPGSSQLPR
jgi:hypothetical protein